MSRMTKRGVLLVAAALFAGGPAIATPFHLRYDAGETYPEQDGWLRDYNDPYGAIGRTVSGGIFRLDTLFSYELWDFYLAAGDALAPQSAEVLMVSWRMRTLESLPLSRPSDVSVSFGNAEQTYVHLYLGTDYVREPGEYGGVAPKEVAIAPGVFHEYVFVTADLQSFALYIDGAFAFESAFHSSTWLPGPFVAFGDTTYGMRSISEWDYVDIAVVPEPSPLVTGALFFSSLSMFGKGGRK